MLTRLLPRFREFTPRSPSKSARALSLFNEHDYLRIHPDVAKAIERGQFSSAFDHFKKHGFAEGRFPGFDGFSSDIYLEINPDVPRGQTAKERYDAAREHFMKYGYNEGREWLKD